MTVLASRRNAVAPFVVSIAHTPYLQGTELRLRTVSDVVDELQTISQKYGVRSFFFVDSIFNVPPAYTNQLLNEMISRNLNLKWHAFDDVRFADAEYMKLATEAGCDYFEFSPDGFSTSSFKALNKDIGIGDIERVCSVIKSKHGMKVTFCFTLNGPGENPKNLLNIILFLLRLKIVLPNKAPSIFDFLYRIRIYPYTRVHEIAVKKGLVQQDYDLTGTVFYNPGPMKYILPVILPVMPVLFNMLLLVFSTVKTVAKKGKNVKKNILRMSKQAA